MRYFNLVIGVVIISAVLLSGCNTKTQVNYKLSVITIPPGQNDDAKLINNILEFSHYVMLDPEEKILISKINKLQLIDGYIAIIDKNKAHLFDGEGKLYCSWDRLGRAGNEYLEMTDMEITRNDGRWECNVYDRYAKKILTYDENSKLISIKDKLPEAQAFKFLGNEMIAFNAGNATSNVSKDECFNYLCHKNGEEIIASVPFNYNYAGHGMKYGEGKSCFYYYENEMYFTSIHNDTIYNISSSTGDIFPYLFFDFGVKRPKINDSGMVTDDYISELHKGRIPSFPNVFYKFSNGYSAEYYYENRPYIVFTDDLGNIIYTGSNLRDKYGLSIRPIPYLDCDNSGYFVSHFKPATIKTAKKICEDRGLDPSLLDELSEKITEDSNPVLVFYKWIYNI